MGKKLAQYEFVSCAFTGKSTGQLGNRFTGTFWGRISVPLPEEFLLGIDQQKREFEQPQWSYFAGRWQYGGWWWYYLATTFLKTPVGTTAIFLAAACFAISTIHRWSCRLVANVCFVLLPVVLFLALVSSQTAFTGHARYALPALPFMLILGSSIVSFRGLARRLRFGFANVAAVAAIAATISVYPHSFSFVNSIVGGPRNGIRWINDAAFDWGQDLWRVRDWVDSHPHALPLYCSVRTSLQTRDYGIDSEPIAFPLKPGSYIVSQHDLLRAAETSYASTDPFSRLRHMNPIAQIGYTHLVFRVESEDCLEQDFVDVWEESATIYRRTVGCGH